jgi:PAS domain S-box-containing protein
VAVADTEEKAPGIRYARKAGLYTTTRIQDLLTLEGLDLIIDLTDSPDVAEELLKSKPPVSIIHQKAARMLCTSLLREIESTDLDSHPPRALRGDSRHPAQTILDSLPYRVMVVNLDMTIAMVNETFLRDENLTHEDVLGKQCFEVRYNLPRPCSESGKACYLEEVKKRRETVSTIHEFETEDGQKRYDVITVSPIFDEKGELTQILEASRDVTSRIALEREVQKSHAFLQQVIQSTVDGIVVVDTKGNVLIFNEGMERLTGYSAKEIMEHGHLTSFYNLDVARENMRKMRSDHYGPLGQLNPTSMTVTAKSGEEIPVTLSASLIKIDGREVGSVGVFTDMREINKMRKDLEEAHLQLVQSERIASVGRMAAGVAHEINNPLSGILIYAELLEREVKSHPQQHSDIREIIDQTLRCKKIVSELLEFSRQSIGKPASFSLQQLITQCLNLLVNQAAFHDMETTLDLETHMPEMAGDMGQLQQVFINLFMNARDAMDGKGKLHVSARYDTDASRFVIKVSDNGPGVPEAFREKIFDMFFTTKPAGKGTGLGLSISQNIIQLHGGSICCECPREGGTTFTILLPLEYLETPKEEPVFVGLDEP